MTHLIVFIDDDGFEQIIGSGTYQECDTFRTTYGTWNPKSSVSVDIIHLDLLMPIGAITERLNEGWLNYHVRLLLDETEWVHVTRDLPIPLSSSVGMNRFEYLGTRLLVSACAQSQDDAMAYATFARDIVKRDFGWPGEEYFSGFHPSVQLQTFIDTSIPNFQTFLNERRS